MLPAAFVAMPAPRRRAAGAAPRCELLRMSTRIPGTPCFTRHVVVSPMPLSARRVYLDAAAAAYAEWLAGLTGAGEARVADCVCLVPQLNPELDVYDRRFLLQLTWACVDVAARGCGLRTRVLVQGTGKFGAVPLSVAGLRRNFDADLKVSRDAWPCVRSGSLENADDLDDDDQVVIVVSPTNAVAMPVIADVEDLVARARGRPVVLLNPRLADVPSHGGMMQVSGRADRLQFLSDIEPVFHLRLLYKSGTQYPVRGILYRAFPGQWQVWRAHEGEPEYRLIANFPDKPSPADITDAFTTDNFALRNTRATNASSMSSGMSASLDTLASSIPLPVLATLALAIVGACAAYAVHDTRSASWMFEHMQLPT